MRRFVSTATHRGLAVVLALVSLALRLCLIPVSRLWLLLIVPARLVAIATACLAGFVWLLIAPATVVSLVSAGCETGYLVKEESFLMAGGGTVYAKDGILVTAVGRTVGDDRYHPFAAGAYTVMDDGDTMRVWYDRTRDNKAPWLETGREPDFTLPKVTEPGLACGLSVGAREPSPVASTPPTVYNVDEVRAGVHEMISASFAASVGPVSDTTGRPIDPQRLEPVTTPCDGGGARIGFGLEFQTADNAASLTRILEAWDAAGYSPDWAIREDIRYSRDGTYRVNAKRKCSCPMA